MRFRRGLAVRYMRKWRYYKRFLIVLVVFCLICFSYMNTIVSHKEEFCYRDQNTSFNVNALEDILSADYKPRPGLSIFFHETACHTEVSTKNAFPQFQNGDYKLFGLYARQACAIESAAFHNPSRDIFVLFASKIEKKFVAPQQILEAILSYPNVNLRKVNLFRYTEGTPVEDWMKGGDLFTSKYLIAHISDFMRLVSLWRYGGICFDLDCILLKSFEQTPLNFIGAESDELLANGVMSFSPNGKGHNITEQCLIKFQQDFDGTEWAENGPALVTRVLKNICGADSVPALVHSSCHGFKIFDKAAFYEIYYKEWEKLFNSENREEVLARVRSSYLVHLWNRLSSTIQYEIGSDAAFEYIIRENCPKVFAVTEKIGFI